MNTKHHIDITALLGFPLNEEEKNELLLSYTEIILMRFFSEHLPTILTTDETQHLEPLITSPDTPEDKLNNLLSALPRLKEELEVFSETQKKTILRESYEVRLKEIESFHSSSLPQKKKEELALTYDKYAHAISLLSQDLWEELYNHWHPVQGK